MNEPKPSILTRAHEYFTRPVATISLADGRPVNAVTIKSPEDWADSSHLVPVDLQTLFGLTDASGIQISRRTAMSLDVVAKGRRVLATNVGRMTLVNKKGGQTAPLQMAYLQQPEEDRPLSQSLIWLADAMLFYPRTWWIVRKRDSYGWPALGGVKQLDRADAEFDDDGKVIAAWGEPVAPRDVITFESPDGGLLHDGLKTLRRAVVLDRAASLAEENPVPSVDIHNAGSTPLDSAQIVELLQSWQAARAKYGAAYSDKSIEVKTLGLDKEQLLLDAQNRMDLKLARQIGIPAWAADVALEGSTLNYQNRQSRAWELIDLYLATYTTAIASRLSMPDTTPIGWTAELDYSVLTRPDQKTRFETYKLGVDGGFIDQTWIDQQEGQPLKLEDTPA